MPAVLTFECPHCKQPVEVPESKLAEAVDCPHCQRRFQAELPLGRSINPQRAEAAKGDAAGETVLKQMHPVVFRNHLFLTALFLLPGLAGLVGLAFWLAGELVLGLDGNALLIASLVGLAVTAGYLAVRSVTAIVVTLTITNVRTVVKRGLLSRQTNELQHDDVRNIKCDQNILERMLNYGDVALSSSGQDDMEIVLEDVPNPQGMIALIREHQ